MSKQNKITLAMAFSVGFVLFSSHAGGGFATGNQANTYYVGLGWLGPIAAIGSMLLLTLTMRQAMVMYNSRKITSAKRPCSILLIRSRSSLRSSSTSWF